MEACWYRFNFTDPCITKLPNEPWHHTTDLALLGEVVQQLEDLGIARVEFIPDDPQPAN